MKTNHLKTHIMRLLKEYGITPHTASGQHFLIDSSILKRIVALVDSRPQDTIVEIGAGLGTLTRELAKRAKGVVAIEKDKTLKPVLTKELHEYKNVQIVIGNALTLLDRFPAEKIVSNTPYLIAEPLIHRLFGLRFSEAILTVPEPFVDILAARPSDKRYSTLSLFSQAFFDLTVHFLLPKTCTYPEAPVDGLVITIQHRQNYRRDPASFVMKALYLQKTKKVRNALREALIALHTELRGRQLTQNQARALIEQMDLADKELETRVRETDLNTFKTILSKVDQATA